MLGNSLARLQRRQLKRFAGGVGGGTGFKAEQFEAEQFKAEGLAPFMILVLLVCEFAHDCSLWHTLRDIQE